MKSRAWGSWQVWIIVAACSLAGTPEAWAAEEGGTGWGAWVEVGRLFNLLCVAAVLVWVARKPLAGFLAARSQAIREQLAEAQRAKQDAEARLAEIDLRMSTLDDELRSIREAAEKEAQDEFRKLSVAADRDAEKILERARREIEGMTRTTQLELKAHAAALAVGLAKERIRGEMTAEDRRRLFSRFVSKVGGTE